MCLCVRTNFVALILQFGDSATQRYVSQKKAQSRERGGWKQAGLLTERLKALGINIMDRRQSTVADTVHRRVNGRSQRNRKDKKRKIWL